MVFEVRQPETVVPLFAGWQETCIWSCLQKIMGHLYVTDTDRPQSVMAILGDFCFFAGVPDKELVSFKPQWCRNNFMIMVPQTMQWEKTIEDFYGERAKKVVRYAIKKEPGIFDKEKLQKVVGSLSDEFCLRMIDEELFDYCQNTVWCRDWVSQYDSFEQYQEIGLGAVVMKDGEPVSGASSYSGYQGGIEVEIITKETYRRRGLAYICGAQLILACMERNWYPSWDARNKWSVALSEKLGYHFDHEYPVYEISDYES